MVEFGYNNAKNTSMGYMIFDLNFRYLSYTFYKEDVNSYSKFKAANKLTKKPRNLMAVQRENIQHA